MPVMDRDRYDGNYAGVAVVSSEAAWTDVAYDDYTTSTPDAIPAGSVITDLFVYNTSSEDPCYLLWKPHGALADNAFDGAFIIPAGTGRAFGCFFPHANSNGGIKIISINGTARVEAIWL